MGGVVSAIFGGGETPKVQTVQTKTQAELAAEEAQAKKDAALAASEQTSLNSDRRRAAQGAGTTLLTGSGLADDAQVKKAGLTYKSTLGGM
jgi:hypothetical protein